MYPVCFTSLVILCLFVSACHAADPVCSAFKISGNCTTLRLSTVVSDIALTRAIGNVFTMSDGSLIAISPMERMSECKKSPNSPYCTQGVGGSLSIESVKYMSRHLQWLGASMQTTNETILEFNLSEQNLLDVLMFALVGKLISGDAKEFLGKDDLDEFPHLTIEQHTGRFVVTESTWKVRTRILETMLIITVITLVKVVTDARNIG
jgi:hypothetical protein